MSSVATFKTMYPEFDGVDDAIVDTVMRREVAALEPSASDWGSCYVQAIELRTAHKLALRARSQASRSASGAPTGSWKGGQLTSERLGDSSKTWKASGASGDAQGWATTQYGIEYVELRKGLAMPVATRCRI